RRLERKLNRCLLSRTFKDVVRTSTRRNRTNGIDDALLMRRELMSCPQVSGKRKPCLISINRDDGAGTCESGALDCIKTNCTGPDHYHGRPSLDLSQATDCPDTGHDPAPDQTCPVKRHLRRNPNRAVLGNNSKLGVRRYTSEMVD